MLCRVMYDRAEADWEQIRAMFDDFGGDGDNVTDWCLDQFRAAYPEREIGKDDIWEYLYGVMHAADWRERYKFDLRRNLPRVPFAPDFEAFRAAGRELMDLHIGYETCEELPLTCEVDGKPDEGNAEAVAYRIEKQMVWPSKGDRSVLAINRRCRLIDIPAEAHEYQVSGRSPLEWAVDSLRKKNEDTPDLTDDPNGWYVWAEDENAFELIRHLRRLAYVGVRSTEIIRGLPNALTDDVT